MNNAAGSAVAVPVAAHSPYAAEEEEGVPKKKEVTRPELATTLLTMTRKNRTVRNAGHHP